MAPDCPIAAGYGFVAYGDRSLTTGATSANGAYRFLRDESERIAQPAPRAECAERWLPADRFHLPPLPLRKRGKCDPAPPLRGSTRASWRVEGGEGKIRLRGAPPKKSPLTLPATRRASPLVASRVGREALSLKRRGEMRSRSPSRGERRHRHHATGTQTSR